MDKCLHDFGVTGERKHTLAAISVNEPMSLTVRSCWNDRTVVPQPDSPSVHSHPPTSHKSARQTSRSTFIQYQWVYNRRSRRIRTVVTLSVRGIVSTDAVCHYDRHAIAKRSLAIPRPIEPSVHERERVPQNRAGHIHCSLFAASKVPAPAGDI